MKYLLFFSFILFSCFNTPIEVQDNYFLSFNFKTTETEPFEFYSFSEDDSINWVNSNTNIDTIILNEIDTNYVSQTLATGYYVENNQYGAITLSYKFDGLVSLQDVYNTFSMGDYVAFTSGTPLEMFHIGIRKTNAEQYVVTDQDFAEFSIFEHSSIYSLGNEQCFDIKLQFDITYDAPNDIDKYIYKGITKLMICY